MAPDLALKVATGAVRHCHCLAQPKRGPMKFVTESTRAWQHAAIIVGFVFVSWWVPSMLLAQDSAGPQPQVPSTVQSPTPNVEADEEPATEKKAINLLHLLARGGWFMVPLGLLSVVVVAISIERFIALRRDKVFPSRLVAKLGELGAEQGGFDPREAYRLCQRYPSAASTVINAMLLKVGRPHSEVEHAVIETSQREAERLHANVRWLSLAASVAPLVGLLGTVWGMIRAFYDSTQLEVGQNKAEALAEGIYTALITTLCGLVIAIPAAILAHYFEAKIASLFHKIDELLFQLLPQIERYEGRIRFSKQSTGNGDLTSDESQADSVSSSKGQ